MSTYDVAVDFCKDVGDFCWRHGAVGWVTQVWACYVNDVCGFVGVRGYLCVFGDVLSDLWWEVPVFVDFQEPVYGSGSSSRSGGTVCLYVL